MRALSLESAQTTCKKKGLWENQGVLKCCWILPERCILSLPTGAGRGGRTSRLSNLGEWSLMGDMKKVHPPLSETGVEEKGGEVPKLLHLVTAEHRQQAPKCH